MSRGSAKRTHTVPWLVGIIVIHVVLVLVYWHYTPWGAPPDEGPHGIYVRTLVTDGLPVFDPEDRAAYEAHQPPLYYILGVPFYQLGESMGLSEPAMAVRALSILLGALAILIVYSAARRVFPGREDFAIGASAFVALLPTHVMLSSSVSNDILVEVVFGLALFMIARIILDGSDLRRAVGLGAILGMGLLTKTTCVLLFPTAIIACAVAWRRKPSETRVLGHAVLACAVGLLIGGGWLLRNWSLYGDPFAMSQFGRAFGHTARPEFFYEQGLSVTQYWMLVVGWTFASFWGVFGHMKVFMPTWAYIGLGVAVGLVKAGVLLKRNADDGTTGETRGVLLVYAVLVALVALSFVGFNTRYFQAQGRYLYPAILPFAVYWVLGVRRLLPARLNGWTPAIAAAVPLVAQLVALSTCIVGGNG